MAVISMVTLKFCNLMLGKYMRKSLKNGKNFQNFQMAVIAMVTLKFCNLMLEKYMRKSLKNTR